MLEFTAKSLTAKLKACRCLFTYLLQVAAEPSSCSRAMKLYTEVDEYLKGCHIKFQVIVLPN